MSCLTKSAPTNNTNPIIKKTLISIECRGNKCHVFIDLPYENGKAKVSTEWIQKTFALPDNATVIIG